MVKGYVYFIKHIPTGKFYYGSRVGNVKRGVSPQDDLWKKYFTHSKKVKRLIEECGKDSFIADILFESSDFDIVFWTEQEYIKNNITNPLCMNVHYKDKTKNQKVFSFGGKKHSEESKNKISRSPWNKGLTKETDERIAKYASYGPWNKGVPTPDTVKQHISEKTKGISKKEETKIKMRKPKSEMHRKNQSLAALRRPKIACVQCGRLISNPNINLHMKVHNK